MNLPWGEFFGAFGLGILTSLHPCPLTTNLAALSLVSGLAVHSGRAVWVGTCYALGTGLGYLAMGALVIGGVFSVPALAGWLQDHLRGLFGPILILAGMFLAGLWPVRFSLFPGFRESLAGRFRARSYGGFGAFFFGLFLAACFCPATAAVFFGVLVPSALTGVRPFLSLAAFGLGTALPVLGLATFVAWSARHGKTAGAGPSFWEKTGPRLAGALLILLGIYFALRDIFEVW